MNQRKKRDKIVAMMPVRNESHRYLKEVLAHLSLWVHAIVILDDASEDDTFEVAQSFKKAIVYRNDEPHFAVHEPALRLKLWELTINESPDWIVAVDADEIFEDRIINEVELLTDQNDYHSISFRVFDFWQNRTHYRVDGGWNPWLKSIPFMVRYNPSLGNEWMQREVHCGRFPYRYESLIPYYSDIRVKHYGWVKTDEHYGKYLYYREKDLKVFGEIRHITQSIQTPPDRIKIEKWKDAKPLYFLEE